MKEQSFTVRIKSDGIITPSDIALTLVSHCELLNEDDDVSVMPAEPSFCEVMDGHEEVAKVLSGKNKDKSQPPREEQCTTLE